jgi:hypothetical protein
MQVIVRGSERGEDESNEYDQIGPALPLVEETSSLLPAIGAKQEKQAPQSNHREGNIRNYVIEIRNPQKPALVGKVVIPLRLRYRREQEGDRSHHDCDQSQQPDSGSFQNQFVPPVTTVCSQLAQREVR